MDNIYGLADDLRDRIKPMVDNCTLYLSKRYEIRNGDKKLEKYTLQAAVKLGYPISWWLPELLIRRSILKEFRQTQRLIEQLVWTPTEGVRKGPTVLSYDVLTEKWPDRVQRTFRTALTVLASEDLPLPEDAKRSIEEDPDISYYDRNIRLLP